jgi:hypothetical protein
MVFIRCAVKSRNFFYKILPAKYLYAYVVGEVGRRVMKKTISLMLIGLLLLVGVSTVAAAPWVYPLDETSPTTTEYWVTGLSAGSNVIDLVLWNHANNKDFVDGMFVIAIKSGDVTIDSVEVNGTVVTLDAEGTGTPGFPFPPGGIFPCDWKQYAVPDLDSWDSDLGWQGAGDDSGVPIKVTLTVNGNSMSTTLFFLAFGYDVQGSPVPLESDTPYSHITRTYTPPDQVIPEVPLGSVVAAGSMMLTLGAFYGLRKRKTFP